MAQEEVLKDVEKEAQIQPKKEFEEINFGVDLETPRPVFISSQLSAKEKEQLVELLKRYMCFHGYMTRCLAWILGWWSILSM